MTQCPCQSGRAYAECCGPCHDGSRPAQSCEALMRSRYSAFALANARYLVATHQGSTDADLADLERAAKAVTWLGLKVSEAHAGANDDEGFVTFTARSLDEDGVTELTETSRFLRVGGRWLYVDGAPSVARVRVERNAPCPCGSGRKFKQCHA